MDNVVFERLEKLEAKIDAIFVSVEQTRNYFKWTMIITLIMFVIPLIGLIIVIPSLMGSYGAALELSGLSGLGM